MFVSLARLWLEISLALDIGPRMQDGSKHCFLLSLLKWSSPMRRIYPLALTIPALLIFAAGSASPADSTLSVLYFLFGGKKAATQPFKNFEKTSPGKGESRRWTLEEALAQLSLQPSDSYLQYVALQLSRRENKIEET